MFALHCPDSPFADASVARNLRSIRKSGLRSGQPSLANSSHLQSRRNHEQESFVPGSTATVWNLDLRNGATTACTRLRSCSRARQIAINFAIGDQAGSTIE